MSSRRSVRALVVNIALTLLAFTLLAVAVYSSRTEIRKVLSRPLDPRLLSAAFAVYMLALVLTFVRWYFLVCALELPFRLRDAMRLGFIGNVFNLVIPGAVGGDVVKAAFLCREQARKTQAVASMVIDRIVGLLGLFILAGISGAVAWTTTGAAVHRLIVIVWAAVGAGLLGLVVLATPTLYHPLARLFSRHGRLEALLKELVATAAAYRKRKGVVAGALLMATGIHSLYVVAFYILSLALFSAQVPSLAKHFLMTPLVLFTTAVPVPFGALGVSETVSGQLFKLVQHPGGSVAMMGYRVLMYAGGLVSLVIYLLNVRQVRELTATTEPEHAAHV